MKKQLQVKTLCTDFLILGGGTAGCYAALSFCRQSDASVLIVEKANIKRSGCLAAGVNAINAYIVPGRKPEDYVAYACKDAEGIARGDLLLTMARKLNETVLRMEELGLVVLKDAQGRYCTRGDRNIKINGENIKPLLAHAVRKEERVTILERTNVVEYIVKDNHILGVYAISIDEPVFYVILAKAVLCATGGAAGLYKPNHPGFSRHKMWYPPFNTGAGYAMGIRAGAEMTTFEMRFIALRCKDTIAPTGTLAQGVNAKQINALGENYEPCYGNTTSQRLHGTVRENREGRGPCYLQTIGINKEQDEDLQRAYLNMAPSQTLKWLESEETPSVCNVEIEGTEPYIVGGHTASGYWVDVRRETTIRGLFAAGDVAGGCPQKYVTGAFAEGDIAAGAARDYLAAEIHAPDPAEITGKKEQWEAVFQRSSPDSSIGLEEEMQEVMDQYAGGIGTYYEFTEKKLAMAAQKIHEIEVRAQRLAATNMRQLVYICELLERLTVCKSVIAHLQARKETRWHSFAENLDYPEQSEQWQKFVNSKLENGKLRVFFREVRDFEY